MSKHAGSRDEEERSAAAVTTIAVVGLLGVVITLLAILRPDAPETATAPAVDLTPAGQVTQSPSPTQSIHHSRPVSRAKSPRPQKVGKAGKALRRKIEVVEPQPPTTFRVSSFNVLGASHTNAGGNKRGWAPAPTRMSIAVAALRAHDVDVVGLQEFEASQAHMFQAQTGGAWGVYPGASGGRGAVRQSIAWRRDTWELVSAATVPIPYFHGNRVPMPYVLLRNLASEREVYFINIHNPATTSRWGDNERWRDVAAGIELALANRLRAQGYPVILTGDFNEHEEVFCRMTAGGTLRAANGGSSGGGCVPPGDVGIDWIFGSPEIEFSGYVRQRSGVERATDHPIVVATAAIPPADAELP